MREPQFSLEISASTVAWYAAIVGTLSLLVSAYTALRDRARLRNKFRRDIQVFGNQHIYDPRKTYVNITVINKGRRPIFISKVAIRIVGNGAKYAILHDSFASHINKILTEVLYFPRQYFAAFLTNCPIKRPM